MTLLRFVDGTIDVPLGKGALILCHRFLFCDFFYSLSESLVGINLVGTVDLECRRNGGIQV